MRQMLEKNEGLERAAEYIRDNDGFVLICHISPDGDTLGSALALYNVMKLYDKRVQIVCQDRVPESLAFLKGADEVLSPDKARHDDCAIAIDCADIARLGGAQSLFNEARVTISIDHHGSNTRFAMQNEVFPRCAATAEIIYELLRLMCASFPRDVADCLYTGLMTDTGCFAFTNVTADTFAIASELVRMGADSAMINRRIFRTVPYRKTKLLGYALTVTELYHGGKTGLCVITQDDLNRFNARADDTEGIIDNIRDIDSVEIAVFIRECLDGDYKVSFRSKEYIDVARIAQDFGGGGHVRAAGFKITEKRDKLVDMVLSAAKEALMQEEDE